MTARSFSQECLDMLDPKENRPGAVWLATIELAGYTVTVVDTSQQACEKALRREYRRARNLGAVAKAEGDPLEWYETKYHELMPGEVEWL